MGQRRYVDHFNLVVLLYDCIQFSIRSYHPCCYTQGCSSFSCEQHLLIFFAFTQVECACECHVNHARQHWSTIELEAPNAKSMCFWLCFKLNHKRQCRRPCLFDAYMYLLQWLRVFPHSIVWVDVVKLWILEQTLDVDLSNLKDLEKCVGICY